MYWAVDSIVLGVRGLAILALFQAAGACLFLIMFERELVATAAWLRSLVRWSALTAALLAMSYYFLVPVRMAGSLDGLLDPVLGAIVSSSSTKPAQIAAFAGLALIAVSIDVRDTFNRVLCLGGTGLALLSFALTGHTTLHELRPLLAPLLVVHVGAAAAWFGALWPLAMIAVREESPIRARVLQRFSYFAVRAVPVLLVCGLLMTLVFAGSIEQLLTAYGAMIALKLAGFTAVLALANRNRSRLLPAMAAGDVVSVQRFRRVVAGEALLLGAIVFVTVFMTGLFAPENLHGSFAGDHT